MSKTANLFEPVLTKRRGKHADKKHWTNLLGSSDTLAIYHGAINADAPMLLLTHDTQSALRFEQELKSLNKPIIMIFNKIDKYCPQPWDDNDLTLKKGFKHQTLEELRKTWMSKSENFSIFISALKKENLDFFRKKIYEDVRKIHVTRFPYNNFLYPEELVDKEKI